MRKSLILLITSVLATAAVTAQESNASDDAATKAEAAGMDMVIGSSESPKRSGPKTDQVIGDAGQRNQAVYGEPLKKLWVPNISSWSVVDNQRLILYVSPFRPYLLTLARKAPGLGNNDRIVFRYDNNHIYARFDRIEVDGFPYVIDRIEKLDRETARALTRRDKGLDGPILEDEDDGDEGDDAEADEEAKGA
ncbi:MAG: DUF6491 family protein [Pseudomonadota bacterium]